MSILDNYTMGRYVKKRVKKERKLPICLVCKNCKNRELCKNRTDTKLMSKCEKCKNCENKDNCDVFYISVEYKIMLPIGKDERTGKLIRKSFSGNDKDDVYLRALNYQKDLESGNIKPTKIKKCPSVIDIITEYLNKKLANNIIGQNTYHTHQFTVNRLKKEKWAYSSINTITRDNIEKFLLKEQYNGKSSSSLKKDYQMIKTAFDIALERDYIEIKQNYFQGKYGIMMPKSYCKVNKPKALTVEEEIKLITYLEQNDNIYKNIILTLLHTGARVGEILALKVKDIDFNSNIIHIRRTTTRDKYGKVILGETTKTLTGVRDIPIIDILKPVLKDALVHKTSNKENLIFCKPNGELYADNTINSAFKRLLKNANIKSNLTTHSLRHTFITRCNEANIPIAAIKSTVGHSDIHITMDVYNDTQDLYMEKEQDKYSKYISNLNYNNS